MFGDVTETVGPVIDVVVVTGAAPEGTGSAAGVCWRWRARVGAGALGKGAGPVSNALTNFCQKDGPVGPGARGGEPPPRGTKPSSIREIFIDGIFKV